MTLSRTPSAPAPVTSPIIDYEPPPVSDAPGRTAPAGCPPPSPAALHRRTPRPLRPVAADPAREPQPPRAAVAFADAALRRVLEIIDRRRPVAQLRPLLAPVLIDSVVALARRPHTAAATLRRLRLRLVDDSDVTAGEVFATYTRARRVHAIAARVEPHGDGWRIVALQIG